MTIQLSGKHHRGISPPQVQLQLVLIQKNNCFEKVSVSIH